MFKIIPEKYNNGWCTFIDAETQKQFNFYYHGHYNDVNKVYTFNVQYEGGFESELAIDSMNWLIKMNIKFEIKNNELIIEYKYFDISNFKNFENNYFKNEV